MSTMSRRLRAAFVVLVASSVTAVGLVVGSPSSAGAAQTPIQPAPTNTVTADRLPTVQIDGIAWTQVVVGNTVYVGGKFNNARPAGAAAGTNLTPRANILAYDITTGNLITTFTASTNAQILSLAASPDGTKIYAVGDFTTANGTARRRVAGFNATTGALLTGFNPTGVNSQARAVTATANAVYVGGGFLGLGNGTLRNNLAAFSSSTGAVLPWNPNADYTVWALAVTADGSSVFAGGGFEKVGGQAAYGLAKIGAAGAGALDDTWKPSVRNAGKDAGITSLRVQNNSVYGTTYHFGPGGNLEGTFKVPVGNSDVTWVTDCHGDNYGTYMLDGVVYSASHAHYCGNMTGGHPQYPTWRFQHAQAWSDTATGDILNDVWGYPNWAGLEPGPAMVNWLPDLGIGNVSGQGQAGWSVDGNANYVTFAGEFPSVNNVGQQGLVRFGKRGVAPAKEGPKFVGNAVVPTLAATSPTSVRVSWPAGYDRDSYALTYKAVRNSSFNAPRYTVTSNSNWWTLPRQGFTDTGLTPGTTYTYSVVTNDSDGNTVYGGNASITMPTTFAAPNAYTKSVRDNGARIYWPLNETGGTVVNDLAAGPASGPGVGVNQGVVDNSLTWGQPGAIAGDTAVSLANNGSNRVYTAGSELSPNTFSLQAWVKTDSTSGGRILGFSDTPSGDTARKDRHIYMSNSGKLLFGVRSTKGSLTTVSSGRSYNDNQWHQITATLSPQGMVLFVDGVRVGRRTDVTEGEVYVGNWRLGGDSLGGWPSQPSSNNLVGSVDEVAIYTNALTQAQVDAEYSASGRTSAVPTAPTDTLGQAVSADDPDLYWRFGEAGGTKAVDSGATMNDGTYRNGPVLGETGVVSASTAAKFDGSNDFVSSDGSVSNPTIYSEEAWFKTTTTRGGKIMGFGSTQDGLSNGYDRHIYMQDDGKLVFGVHTGQNNVITTPGSYNDGGWHHFVATQSGNGMKFYVDGVLTGTNPQTKAQDYAGYWKVGGDNTWGSSSAYFDGTIDEVAVYSSELSQQRALDHYLAGGGRLNQAPTAAFTSTSNARKAAFDGTGSTDTDGTVVAYSWNFGDGSTATGPTPNHTFASAGTFDVTLTVNDNKGTTGTVTRPVTVTAPPVPADAYGSAVVADGPALFWRFDEASGSTAVDAGGAAGDGTYFNGYTLGQTGALPIANKAAQFDGNHAFVSSNDTFDNPTTYSEEAWFKTTTTRGGKIIGFGDNRTDSSGSYDRHVYMQDDGHVVFGAYTGALETITTPGSYNNGQWHHVVATQSGNGMKLYLDGDLIGTNPNPGAQSYTGHWKVAGDNTWNSSSPYFDGTIDEAAVYLKELSSSRVSAHYAAAQPAPNAKPKAAFDSTKAGLTVTTDGSTSSDTDGSIVNYAWDFGDGWTTAGVDQKTASHTYATAGTKTITLKVTDDDGDTDTVSHDVTVVAPNQLPTAAIDASVDNLDVTVDGGDSTDPDGTIVSYAWDFGDGSTDTGKTPGVHRYATAGQKTITLTVTDNDGATDTKTATVTATRPPNQAPVAGFNASTNNLVVTVSGASSTDPDGTIASYDWNFGDGATDTGKTPAPHTYTSGGTKTVTLTVTDNDGATNAISQEVTVSAANQSPSASFTAGATNLKVDVDAGASADPDGSIASYEWSFGEGQPGTGVTDSHTYTTAGEKTITLTVTDNKGASTTVSKTVTVS